MKTGYELVMVKCSCKKPTMRMNGRLEEKAVELCQPYIDVAASSSSDTAPVTIRAAHMNPGATKEQIAADDAIMEGEDFL